MIVDEAGSADAVRVVAAARAGLARSGFGCAHFGSVDFTESIQNRTVLDKAVAGKVEKIVIRSNI